MDEKDMSRISGDELDKKYNEVMKELEAIIGDEKDKDPITEILEDIEWMKEHLNDLRECEDKIGAMKEIKEDLSILTDDIEYLEKRLNEADLKE